MHEPDDSRPRDEPSSGYSRGLHRWEYCCARAPLAWESARVHALAKHLRLIGHHN